jgi:hypothetical protein
MSDTMRDAEVTIDTGSTRWMILRPPAVGDHITMDRYGERRIYRVAVITYDPILDRYVCGLDEVNPGR